MVYIKLFVTILFASSVKSEECLWKACDADEGSACYKIRNFETGISDVKRCKDVTTIFNPLSCAYRDEDKVCITEDEMVLEAASLNSEFNKDMVCSGKGWKGAMGNYCYKRLSNRKLVTFTNCASSCTDELIDSEIAAPDSVAKNLYLRHLGPQTNIYWVALVLNSEGNGWEWLNDGSELTEDQSFFNVSITEKIEEIKAANGGSITTDQACIVQTFGDYEFNGSPMGFAWDVTNCDHETQCMCQSDAKLNMCEWKSCDAKKGDNCYRRRIRGKWKTKYCENEGEIFNNFVCETKNESEVCRTEETEAEESESSDTLTPSINYKCDHSWKGYSGPFCYKRFKNTKTKDFDDCRQSCWTDLAPNARMIEPDGKDKNVFTRIVGHQSNIYWIGLKLNDEGDGWNWLSTGEALTEDVARFDGTIDEEIAELKVLHNDTIPASEACVMSVNDEDSVYAWQVGSCEQLTQCMCQKPAWTPDQLNNNGNVKKRLKRRLKLRRQKKQDRKNKKNEDEEEVETF